MVHNNLKLIIDSASKFAKSFGLTVIETEHLLYGVIEQENSYASKCLRELGITKDMYIKVIKSYQKNIEKNNSLEISYSKPVEMILKQIDKKSLNSANYSYYCEDILRFLLSKREYRATKVLISVFNIDINKLVLKLDNYLKNNQQKIDEKVMVNYTETLPDELKDLGYDLTQKAKFGALGKVVGRDSETERVIEILCRKTKNNPVLLGEPGVGKSAVVEGLAQRIAVGEVPELLKGKIIFSFDIASLVSGTKFRGSMEQKLKNAISAIQKNNDIIMYIDEIHILAQAGSKDGEISPSDILKPYLARGELRCIGTTTYAEYKSFIEVDPALERRFQTVNVDEPSIQDTILILKGIRPSFENFHNCKISDEAIEEAVNLSVRYITNRFLPDKAIDLIDEACSKLKVTTSVMPESVKEINLKLNELERQKAECLISGREDYLKANEINNQKKSLQIKLNEIMNSYQKTGKALPQISAESIRQVVSSWTKIPVSRLSSTEREKLLSMEKLISERVIGQPNAVSVVSNAIRRAKADINDPNRPIGSFLFLGPTGVGKTELSKALGEVVFDSSDAIIRFDMSEFMESHSVARLIGAPPGYVGYDEGGELTEAVKNKPYSIVLFDEIEKAHPDIFNILLQIFDEGRLTDTSGKHINFRNTIVILTSNNGVQDLLKRRKYESLHPDETKVDTDEFLMHRLQEKFKPELLNRIDQVVIFDSLSKESVLKITNLMVESLIKRLDKKYIKLIIDDSAKNLICDKGYDIEYGARPIRKVIDKEIKDPLANMIIKREIVENNVVKIEAVGGEFKFKVIC